MAAVPAAIEALAPAVKACVDPIPATIQTGVDAVAPAVETGGAGGVAVGGGPVGATIQAGVDAVAATVEVGFDPVAPAVEAVLDAVAPVGGDGLAGQQGGEEQGEGGHGLHADVLPGQCVKSWRSDAVRMKGNVAGPERLTPCPGCSSGGYDADWAEWSAVMSDGFVALYIFMLAAIAGHVIISRVPVILHTPLMSGSNFIHGIVLIGAMVVLGHADTTLEKTIGFIAVLLGAGNAAGGYVVTERMLDMFKSSKKEGKA